MDLLEFARMLFEERHRQRERPWIDGYRPWWEVTTAGTASEARAYADRITIGWDVAYPGRDRSVYTGPREATRRMATEKQRKLALKQKLIRAAVASPEKRRVLLSEGFDAFDLPCAPGGDPESLEAWQEFCWAVHLAATKFDHPAVIGQQLEGAAELLRWANPVLEVLRA